MVMGIQWTGYGGFLVDWILRSKRSGIKLWLIKSIFSILLLLLIIIVPGSLGSGKGHYATCKIGEAIRLATEADPDVNYLSGMPCKALEDLFSSLSHFFSEDAKHVCDYQLVLQCHIKSDAGRKCNVWQHIACVITPEKPLEGIQPTPSTTNFSVNSTDFLVQGMFGVFLNRRNDQPLENTVDRYRKVDLSRNDIGYRMAN